MFNIHDVIATNVPNISLDVKLTDAQKKAKLEYDAARMNAEAIKNLPDNIKRALTQTYNATIVSNYNPTVKNCPYPPPPKKSELGMVFSTGINNLSFNANALSPLSYSIAPISPQLKPINLPTTLTSYVAPTKKESALTQIVSTISPYDLFDSAVAKAATKAAELAINNLPTQTKEKFLEQKALDAKKLALYQSIEPTITGVKNNASAGVVSDVKRTAPVDNGMMHTMMPGQEVVDVNAKKVDLMKFVPVAVLLWNILS